MKKIHTGANHSLWQFSAKNNGLTAQMMPLKCEKIFGRSTDKFDKGNIGGWDCDCGIYVIGSVADVEAAFTKLYAWMAKKTDSELVEDDLASDDALIYMGLFKSDTQDLAVIIGGGYYESTDPELEKMLYNLKKVSVGELGANYSDDNDLYKLLSELVDAQAEDKDRINKHDLALLSEVFPYWEKKDIETQADRIDNGYEYVDAAVEKFNKKRSVL